MTPLNTPAAASKVLFVTNSESGQANSILALALELLTRPSVEVHVGSFPPLKARVEKLDSKLNFHILDGLTVMESIATKGAGMDTAMHPPGYKCPEVYRSAFVAVLTFWEDSEYTRICDSIRGLIMQLKPDLVVVDSFLFPGLDACYSLGQKFVWHSPNTPMDLARTHQPWLKGGWYYPAMASGIAFPVPWRHFITNIWISILAFYHIYTSPAVSKLIEYRNSHGLPGRFPALTALSRAAHTICPGVPELDFPMVIPDNLGLYGPIVLDTNTVEVVDPELNQWLGRGETVMMCMGTHFHYSESQIKAIINGFLSAVNRDSNTQFLWKLSNKSRFEDLINGVLKHPRDKERFRIVDWLEADPASIMKHPNVVAYIHHGGANSYYEAAFAGLPQIILAQWFDLYDMAVRAEYRGIGIYGNKKVAPDIEAVEFGAAIARVTRPGEEPEGFRERARAVGEVCRKAGGKRAAVDKILELIAGKE